MLMFSINNYEVCNMARIMKSIWLLVLLAAVVVSPGCADINKTNELIAAANAGRLTQYAAGMAACGENAGCQVGLSAAFFSGSGQQNYFRPETPIDYLREGRLWLDPVSNIIERINGYGGTSGDRSLNSFRGDGNIIMVGNKVSAAGESSTSFSLNPSFTRSYDGGNNRHYTGGGTVTDEGVNTAQIGE